VGGVNLFKPYTANAYRRVHDLQIWGGVGQHPLTWRRNYTSRSVGGSKYYFGFQCNWRHSYQWEIADAGAARRRWTFSIPMARSIALSR
jgi:hypothetical protein